MQKTLLDRSPKFGGDRASADARPYALGYAESEFKRLEMQGMFLGDLTEEIIGAERRSTATCHRHVVKR